MKRFLTKVWENKGKELKVQIKVDEKAPLQSNSYDCSVFICENAERITRKEMTKPKQEDMQKARKIVMKEIFW